jgi:hypothetical protein
MDGVTFQERLNANSLTTSRAAPPKLGGEFNTNSRAPWVI